MSLDTKTLSDELKFFNLLHLKSASTFFILPFFGKKHPKHYILFKRKSINKLD